MASDSGKFFLRDTARNPEPARVANQSAGFGSGLLISTLENIGRRVAKWLALWNPDREVRVRALPGSLCCVYGQETLLSQCLSPARSINGYQKTSRQTGRTAGGLPAMDYHPIQEE